MIVTSSDLGVSGERDEDGYCGRYTLGTEWIFHDDTGFVVAIQLAATPSEIVMHSARLNGVTQFSKPPVEDALFQAAVAHALALPGVERVSMLVGEPVVVASRG